MRSGRLFRTIALSQPTPRAFAALSSVLIFIAPSLAQSGLNRDQEHRDDSTVQLRVDEEAVPIAVQSDSAYYRNHLSKSDFQLLEDGAQRNVVSLKRVPNSIVFVLDNSIEWTKFKDTDLNRAVALRFINKMGADDEAAIVSYGGKVSLLQNWTGDKDALKEALSGKFKLGAKAHLYDSLLYAAGQLLARRSGCRLIVLLTDGYDDFNRETLDQARLALDREKVTLYVVDQSEMILASLDPNLNHKSLSNLLSRGVDRKYAELVAMRARYAAAIKDQEATMESLAEDCGGDFRTPETPGDFETAADAFEFEMASMYMMSYQSAHPPDEGKGEFRKLIVYSNHPGVTIRIRHGLYSKAGISDQPSAVSDKAMSNER